MVTGARGFLGRHLTAALAGSNCDIVKVSRRPVDGMIHVEDYTSCPEGDVIVHLAESADRAVANASGRRQAAAAETVVTALARRCNRLIYASSGAVYGDEGALPFDVDRAVITGDLYATSKLRNEELTLDAGGAVARLSNLVGDGMAPNNVVSDILRQIPGHGPLLVRDDRPLRDFLDAADAAAALARLIDVRYQGVLNVGSGVGTSIGDLALLALTEAGEQCRPVVATARTGRRSASVLDITRTVSVLDWAPTHSLSARLRQLVLAGARS